jgi:hypothetical protein
MEVSVIIPTPVALKPRIEGLCQLDRRTGGPQAGPDAVGKQKFCVRSSLVTAVLNITQVSECMIYPLPEGRHVLKGEICQFYQQSIYRAFHDVRA